MVIKKIDQKIEGSSFLMIDNKNIMEVFQYISVIYNDST